jgi:NAD(P)-dependent dehydrogenase (short-subunit alcohol dehydrogenase family)
MENTQKTAVVTGASQGIGAGAVQAFWERGYRVVANSRNISRANPFPASADLALVEGDIGDPKTAAEIADTAVSRFGQIDALVNNVGIYISKPFTDYTMDDLRSLVSVNIDGFVFITQLVIKRMLAQ